MDGTRPTCSSKSDLPFDYFAESASVDAADPRTEESEQSMDDSGASTPTHDTDFFENGDYIRVIKPYAIEEPDDEPTYTMPRPDVLCLPDQFERWQRDLEEYMNKLNPQSNEAGFNPISSMRKRGQKRKPAHTTGACHYCYPHSKQRHVLGKVQPGVCDHCTKRRRVSKQLDKDPNPQDSFEDFRDANSNDSSSSETRSSDLSDTDAINDSPVVDEMDID